MGNCEIIPRLEEKQKIRPLSRRELMELLLTPLRSGKMPQAERISRGMKLLQNEREHLTHEDLVQMQSVLYTLAMKFLTTTELKNIREVLDMTILGEMLMQDGLERGRLEGQKALERVNRLNVFLVKSNRTEDILKASEDEDYRKKLFEEFHL